MAAKNGRAQVCAPLWHSLISSAIKRQSYDDQQQTFMFRAINDVDKTGNEQPWQALHCFYPPEHRQYHPPLN